ncbi:MAG: carbohydrate-binding family 9-like protein [Bryobacterales bacterium]|nr:carbohydrate-binding family 9-like protein [Bryobacterales bacterium]
MILHLFLCTLATPAPAQSYEVHRAATKIIVDGKLDDTAWKRAATTELQFPWDQPGAKQKTVVRLLWDDDYLYAAYDCDDADIVAHFDKRDDPTYRMTPSNSSSTPTPGRPSITGWR